MDEFIRVCGEQLAIAHAANPENYSWPIEKLPDIIKRVEGAVRTGNFHKDSPTIKAACKILGIKHTYKAIKEFTA